MLLRTPKLITQNTLRSSFNLVWKYEIGHWSYSHKSRFGNVLKRPFSSPTLFPDTPGQDQRWVLLFLLAVTCLKTSYRSLVIKIHNFFQPLLRNVKTQRESLLWWWKCESSSNERDGNHSCGNLELKFTSYQPETHLEPEVC